MVDATKPLFWRDSRMPHVELRKVDDGRKVCYAPHSHTQWSLGAITAGESTFLYRDDHYPIQAAQSPPKVPAMLQALVAYLDTHAAEDISLDALCERSGYSPGHLIRAFKQHFGFTPHAYLINRRIQMGQRELKGGKPIAEAALNAGFSDQPYFKRLVAATPSQYRQPLPEK